MHTVCKFKCISKPNSKVMKMIDYNISYFASEFEILDPGTALMFLIGLRAHSYLLTTFQVPLIRVRSDG